MSNRATARSPRPVCTLVLWAVLLLALLTLPTTALARSHRSACAARTATHVKAKSRRPKCAVHARKGARKTAAKHHAPKHAAKTHSRSVAAAPSLIPALCEDESSPRRAADGTFSCSDGSEPACEDESSPIRSGHALKCVVSAPAKETPCEEESAGSFCLTGSSGSGEPMCEDGSTPTQTSDASSPCDDGSEPVCEDESTPVALGDDNTLVCGIEFDSGEGD
jgi:hypothetical protein